MQNENSLKNGFDASQEITIDSTEIWKCIPSLPGFDASSQGRIRRTFGNGNVRVVHGTLHKSGYLRLYVMVGGTRKVLRIHRLVAESFFGECPEGYVVNHIDGVKINNRPSNIEYVTQRQNVQHAWKLGLATTDRRKHFRNPRKLTDRDVHFIRENRGKLTQGEIGQILGVSAVMVSKVQNGYVHRSACPETFKNIEASDNSAGGEAA